MTLKKFSCQKSISQNVVFKIEKKGVPLHVSKKSYRHA